jgi:membrane-associated PAP2 superfamily phosphatase
MLLLSATLLEYSGFDLWLEGHFFDPQLGWIYRDHWLTSNVLHHGGKYFIILMGILVLFLYLASFKFHSLKAYQKGFLACLVGSLSGILIVAAMKKIIPIYSPWDLVNFGGHMPYIRIFDHRPLGQQAGHAFPAGHASGAFSLLCFYYFVNQFKLQGGKVIFASVVILGILYGGAQQMRGAHFLSHDVVAFVICWLANKVSFYVFFDGEEAQC